MNFLIYTLDAAGDTHKNVNHIVEARNKNNVYCWAPVATREAEIRRIAISGLAQAKKKKKKNARPYLKIHAQRKKGLEESLKWYSVCSVSVRP
jgi:hypothetical protein